MDTNRVVFNSHAEAADAWLGGDSPWVCRIIGITPAPQVGSLYNEGIWDSDTAVWRGKDVVRKTKTQAKKFLAKMMAVEEEDKEDDADADEEGDESNDGDGDGGDEGDGPGAGLGATGADRDGGVGEEVEGVEGERMEVEGVEGEGVVGEGVEGEGVEGEGVVGEGVEGEGVVGEGVVVGEGDGGDSGAGDKRSGAPAGPPTTHDF